MLAHADGLHLILMLILYSFIGCYRNSFIPQIHFACHEIYLYDICDVYALLRALMQSYSPPALLLSVLPFILNYIANYLRSLSYYYFPLCFTFSLCVCVRVDMIAQLSRTCLERYYFLVFIVSHMFLPVHKRLLLR